MKTLKLILLIAFLSLNHTAYTKQQNKISSQVLKKNSTAIEITVNNKTIVLTSGNYSFADSVAFYDPGARGNGTGDEPAQRFQHPEEAIGAPELKNDSGFVSLGRNGTIILKFNDNCLIDEPGPDLCIFIRKQDNEAASVWVSQKGNFYYYAGNVNKDNSFLDLNNKVPDGLYQYVKIKDIYQNRRSGVPDSGVDIDGVAAINCVIRKTIQSDLIFSSAGSTIIDSSNTIFRPIAQLIKSFNSPFIIIRAYSDGWGSSDYKLLLTQEQVTSIQDYFIDIEHMDNAVFSVIGMGNRDPAASNNSVIGRKKNRRIEILIYPEKQ